MPREDWVTMEQALERVQRSRSTVYQWVQDGRVSTMRPGRVLWLNLPDLIRAEFATRPGRPKRNQS